MSLLSWHTRPGVYARASRPAARPERRPGRPSPAKERPASPRAGAVRAPARAVAHRDGARGPWGALPALGLISALGLLTVALADGAARVGASEAGGLFWVGVLAMFGPIALRLVAADASGRERLGLVVACSVGLYLVKVLQSPTAFTFHDELSHWRTVDDLVQSRRLFSLNPLLPISALYPGLENVTDALMLAGGLGAFVAGILVVGAAKVVLALALYLFYARVSASPRLAGLAALTYMANPSFLFFDGQFAYESLGIPLAVFTLVAVARHVASGKLATPWTLVGILALAATITTHHLTGLLLTAFLGVWALTHAYTQGRGAFARGPALFALLGLAGTLLWIGLVSRDTIGYLFPDLRDSLRDLTGLLSGSLGMRRLFSDYAGESLPFLERVFSYLSIALVLAGLPFGLVRIARAHRDNALALALGVATLAYPVSLALRLSDRGVEASVRSSEFLFIALGYVLAIVVDERVLSRRADSQARLAVAAAAVSLFVGGVVLGWAPSSRLPGPYLVAADPRSIEPEGVSAAWWARDQLGFDNRLDADRINTWLMGSYGRQRVVTALVDKLGVWPPFFSPTLTQLDRRTIAGGRIRYLVVDLRLSTSLPHVGLYVERGEADEFRRSQPIPRAALTKYDGMPGVSRLFDSGNLAIYDVEALGRAP